MEKDVLDNMTIEDLKNVDSKVLRACYFAVIAHKDQARKVTPEIPYVIHPMEVANIISKYSRDKNLRIAGYLHDVVEMTDYTLDDICYYFGSDVKELVASATGEKDKSVLWETRKQMAIDNTRDLPFRNKLLIAADKTNNIESLKKYFDEIGYNDFSSFNCNEEQQEWYYRNIYMSLIHNEYKNHPLFNRLENGINDVYGRTMEEYFSKDKKLVKF